MKFKANKLVMAKETVTNKIKNLKANETFEIIGETETNYEFLLGSVKHTISKKLLTTNAIELIQEENKKEEPKQTTLFDNELLAKEELLKKKEEVIKKDLDIMKKEDFLAQTKSKIQKESSKISAGIIKIINTELLKAIETYSTEISVDLKPSYAGVNDIIKSASITEISLLLESKGYTLELEGETLIVK